MPVTAIADALFTKTQQKVLGLLFAEPGRSFYTNEIMRCVAMGRGTVSRELQRLVSAGLLEVSREGNQLHYRANAHNPVFSELLGIVRKTLLSPGSAYKSTDQSQPLRNPSHYANPVSYSVMEQPSTWGEDNADGMIRRDNDRLMIGHELVISFSALQQVAQQFHIQQLGLFGSAARGELRPDSDIDLLVEFEENRAPSLAGMLDLQHALSVVFHERKVDLATASILNNPYRRQAIEKDLQVLYAA